MRPYRENRYLQVLRNIVGLNSYLGLFALYKHAAKFVFWFTSWMVKRLFHAWFTSVNKLTSVFHASVLLLIMNFVITSPRGSANYFDNVMTKFIVNNRTDA